MAPNPFQSKIRFENFEIKKKKHPFSQFGFQRIYILMSFLSLGTGVYSTEPHWPSAEDTHLPPGNRQAAHAL